MSWKPVFFDPTSQRGRWLSGLTVFGALAGSLLAAAFAYGVLILPELPQLSKLNARQLFAIPVANPAPAPRIELRTVQTKVIEAPTQRSESPGRRRRTGNRPGRLHPAAHLRSHVVERVVTERDYPLLMPASTAAMRAPAAADQRTVPLSIGFYVSGDEESYLSLEEALPKLDWVAPTWLTLKDTSENLETRIDQAALDLVRKTRPSVKIVPLLQNLTEGAWDGPAAARQLANPISRGVLIDRIVSFLGANGLDGAIVDLEALPKSAQPDLVRFLDELHHEFAPRGWLAVVAVPLADAAANDTALAQSTDYTVLMAYDEHDAPGGQGAIASQDWYVRNLASHMQRLDPAHTIVALGSFGYDWSGPGAAQTLSFRDAIQSARESKSRITFDHQSLNPHFAFREEPGDQHDVWMLDAVTAFNQIRAADEFRPAGYAVWRLGSEDPSIWSVLGRPYRSPPPARLAAIAPGQDVDYQGSGEIMQVTAQPQDGNRTFDMDRTNQIVMHEEYINFPSGLVVTRSGAVPGKVALTFDDGPSPDWTPQILDVLKAKGVHATFFIVGVNAHANPALVARMVAEWHDVGNHTFTHPNLAVASEEVVRVELNATQRLFQSLTGRAMRLFRPPYIGDAEPRSPDAIEAIKIAHELGYITVGLKVDPGDWLKPPAARIVARVLAQVSDPDPELAGQIVLLHDAGGDRTQTLAALPMLIDGLRARGFALAPVSELAGLSRDQAMPLFPNEPFMPAVNSSVFLLTEWLQFVLHWMIVAAIGLGFARLAALVSLAVWDRLRTPVATPLAVHTGCKVSVLIPAFNEAKVIADSIGRILSCTYQDFEVIVIDDGSTDPTAAVVRDLFGNNRRVRLLCIANSGKAQAINTGLRVATGEVVVALDADTQFEPETIARLTRWFADPGIGAVAGNAKVGNRINALTRWQALEYVTAQNLERRALAMLGCMTVVPGAVGAWRLSALQQLGGFPRDTLAEDQDLTIAIQKAGYRIVFDPEAVAWTEAPDTLGALARQRLRWSFGTLQCLWKHRDVTFNPRYGALGLVALPQVWLFQILLALFAPVVDLMLIVQLISTYADYLQHGEQFDTANLSITCTYYALFMAVDLSAAAIAMAFERKEQWGLLWWLAVQRFGYRQLMYYVVAKSVVSALMGRLVGWGKAERKATVMVAAE